MEAHVDRAFPLKEVVDAHRYVEAERNFGKMLLTMAGDPRPTAGRSDRLTSR